MSQLSHLLDAQLSGVPLPGVFTAVDLRPSHSTFATAQRVQRGDSLGRPSGELALKALHERGVWGNGGPCRDRTYDQLIKSQLLYQLS